MAGKKAKADRSLPIPASFPEHVCFGKRNRTVQGRKIQETSCSSYQLQQDGTRHLRYNIKSIGVIRSADGMGPIEFNKTFLDTHPEFAQIEVCRVTNTKIDRDSLSFCLKADVPDADIAAVKAQLLKAAEETAKNLPKVAPPAIKPVFRNNPAVRIMTDFMTTPEQTAANLLQQAAAKRRANALYINQVGSFMDDNRRVKDAAALVRKYSCRNFLLTAAGLSPAEQKLLSEEDQNKALQSLLEDVLLPAGNNFLNAAAGQFLLTHSQEVVTAQQEESGKIWKDVFLQAVQASLRKKGIQSRWISDDSGSKALCWKGSFGSRILAFDIWLYEISSEPVLDFGLFEATEGEFRHDWSEFLSGILVCGMASYTADIEQAKSKFTEAMQTLKKCREYYEQELGDEICTAFVGASISRQDSCSIFGLMESAVKGEGAFGPGLTIRDMYFAPLDNAANLTISSQLTDFCDWLVEQ